MLRSLAHEEPTCEHVWVAASTFAGPGVVAKVRGLFSRKQAKSACKYLQSKLRLPTHPPHTGLLRSCDFRELQISTGEVTGGTKISFNDPGSGSSSFACTARAQERRVRMHCQWAVPHLANNKLLLEAPFRRLALRALNDCSVPYTCV